MYVDRIFFTSNANIMYIVKNYNCSDIHKSNLYESYVFFL